MDSNPTDDAQNLQPEAMASGSVREKRRKRARSSSSSSSASSSSSSTTSSSSSSDSSRKGKKSRRRRRRRRRTKRHGERRVNELVKEVEAGILARTLHIISSADPTVELALVNHKKLKIDDEEPDQPPPDMAKKSLHDLSQLVAQTAQKLSQVRQEIQPLAEKIKPVKEEFQSVQQQYEQKKRAYDAASINITSQMQPIRDQVKDLTDQLEAKEDEWKTLRQKIEKAESLQEIVASEMKNSIQSPRKPSKMEALKKRIEDMERKVKQLEEEQSALSSRQVAVETQTRLWQRTVQLLQCALRARAAPAARPSRVHITRQTQMLTLS